MMLSTTESPEFWNITLGNLITIVVFVVGLIGSHIQNNKAANDRFNKLEFKLDLIWNWFEGNKISKT